MEFSLPVWFLLFLADRDDVVEVIVDFAVWYQPQGASVLNWKFVSN